MVKIVEQFGRYVEEHADELVGEFDKLTEYDITLHCAVDIEVPSYTVIKRRNCVDALKDIRF